METNPLQHPSCYGHFGSYPTYEEWKLFLTMYKKVASEFVLILPMRNGNIKRSDIMKLREESSYPTYEEWKLLQLFFEKVALLLCSYPTYEE